MAAASWAITANLLAAAAATPLIGRLADLHSKKRVLLVVLGVVLVGTLLAALTTSLPLLIVARVLQAASYGLYPIGIAILREELAEDRMGSAMSVLSGTLGFGGGTGLVVVGLLMSGHAGYHRVFWLATAFTLVVVAIVVFLVPARTRSSIRGPSTGSERRGWPQVFPPCCWRSRRATRGAGHHRRRSGCAAGGVLILTAWWFWERRAKQPLVSTEMMTRRSIMLTNLATVFVGMGLYFAFLGLTQFVQIPHQAAGYGFGATVLQASVVYLLPGALDRFRSSPWSAVASSTDSAPDRFS